MSDLNGRTYGRVIRVSSSGGTGYEGCDARLGFQLDRVRNPFLWQGDTGRRDVDRDSVVLLFRSQDLVLRNGDHLSPLLVVEEVMHGARHSTQFHEEKSRIIRIPAGGRCEEKESRLVTVQMALHRAQQWHSVAVVVHGYLRGRVGLVEHSIGFRAGPRDLGERHSSL